MAAQMLNNDNIKKMLIEDVAFNFNWSDTDSEGYDGDTEEFMYKFHNISNVNFTDEEINYNFQKPEDNNGLNKDSNDNEQKSTSVGAESQNMPIAGVKSITDCFLMFFDENLLNMLVNCTNLNIDVVRKNYSRERDCQETSLDEIKALIGLLILTGLLKYNLKVDDLWEKGGVGVEIFRLTMSLRRFKFLLRYIHFTSPRKYKPEKKVDNPNKSEGIIDNFLRNCNENFKSGESIIISRKILTTENNLDEVPNESASSGLVKYYAMDTDYYYISKLEFYNKKIFNDSLKNCITHSDALNYVLNNQNKDITMILDQSCKQLDLNLSELENFPQVDLQKNNSFTTEELLNKYSVMGQTKRLVLKLLLIMIDLACLNSSIIFHLNIDHNLSRKEFLKKLGLDLVTNQIKNRATCQYLSRELRDEASNFLSLKLVSRTFDKIKNKPVRCVICPRKADKKVRSYCYKCEKPMCQVHMTSLCDDCFNIE